ncbi:MAG TPA: LPXTG cell wall anchor domain-containing protein [Anaerolineaceae bacterium]|nr:LPXTG cell wall anchor domain-containing protein [Anaerolineaceae bacterium]
MSDDYNDLDLNNENEEGGEQKPPPQQQGSNRTFLIAAGVLGGLFLLALALLVVYLVFIRPNQGGVSTASRIATQNAINTATVQAITQAAINAQRTTIPKSPTQTPLPTATLRPTNTATPVLAIATTAVPGLSQDEARTATVAALLTQAALAQQTGTGTAHAPTSTALPTTGFADEVGLPGLFGLGLILLAVIFVVRRLRSS